MNNLPIIAKAVPLPREMQLSERTVSRAPLSGCFGGAVFLMIAVWVRWCAAPTFERLPADYVAEMSYTATFWSRQRPWLPAEKTDSFVHRHDRTLTSADQHSIIQGDVHWSTTAGVMIFETLNTYGVDRNDRQNLAAYGSENRQGQYLFPPHTQKKQYRLWDPVYAGPRVATFDHVEKFHGVEVYVFNTLADRIDDTAEFATLPDIPQIYHALNYGKGRLWIEPVSGVALNHQDSGMSYFVDAETGERVGEPAAEWTQRYTPETIQEQVWRAVAIRRGIRALEIWLPLTFAAAGLFWITARFRISRDLKR